MEAALEDSIEACRRQAEAAILSLMATESTRRLALHRTLECCLVPMATAELDARMARFPELTESVFSAPIIRQWLEKAGGMEGCAIGEGQPGWRTTEAGRRVHARMDLSSQISALLDSHPQYRGIYIEILRFCQVPRDKDEIERAFEEHPSLAEPRIFPTAPLYELESAGAVEWDGQWRITAIGEKFLG